MNRGKKRSPLSRVAGSIHMPSVGAPKIPNIKAPKVKPDEALKAIGKAAGQVAQRSQRVGEVASEVQKASDAINGGKR